MHGKTSLIVGIVVLLGLAVAAFCLFEGQPTEQAPAPAVKSELRTSNVGQTEKVSRGPSMRRMASNDLRNRMEAGRMKGINDPKLLDLKRTAFSNPKDPASWKALGDAYAEKGQYDLAIAVVRRMTHYNPDEATQVEVDRLVKGYEEQKQAAVPTKVP